MHATSTIPPAFRSKLRESLRGCRLFQGMTESELCELEGLCVRVRLRRFENVWKVGDRATSFHVLLEGLVELRRPAGGYDATVMAIFGPTECLAVPVALTRGVYGAAAVVVSAHAVLLTVQAAPLLERMGRDVRLALAFNAALLEQVQLLHRKIDVMSAGTVQQRLLRFLFDLADRFGDEFEDGEIQIPFSLSREQLAHYVNAREETVIRALSAWRKEGLIEFRPGAIVFPRGEAIRETLAA
jgi:CRP-like cAMP-binding protein